MYSLALLLVLVPLAACSKQANWIVFKAKHNKTYTGDEDMLRRKIWETNLQKIEQHNELYSKGLSSYYMGENRFTDMSHEEFVKNMNGMKVSVHYKEDNFTTQLDRFLVADNVDWRTKGFVTPIKDQGQCGSCWAFSSTGSLEGQHFRSTGRLVSLSESNLVDCSSKWGNNGCSGGLMTNSFQYVMDNKGLDTEQYYPYVPQQSNCRFAASAVGATIRGYKNITKGSEGALQKAVASVGPISVAIDASHDSFQFYSGGVYDEPACSSTLLDHGVLVVGYGSGDANADYWIVKNSWGQTWGSQGYIYMIRNKGNQCGIATMASYPVV